MIEPLIEGGVESLETGSVLLRCLLARIRLLGRGDVDGVFKTLGAFQDSTQRQRLDPVARAEVCLWLGWAHVWNNGQGFDDARSLSLLEEAAAGFRKQSSALGLCWTYIAQAQAFAAIDEHPLMAQAVEEASALHQKLDDVQVAIFLADLAIHCARSSGRYVDAEQQISDLLLLAQASEDEFHQGQAYAWKALIASDLGRRADSIIADAEKASLLLDKSNERAGGALQAAYDASIDALMRKGDWSEAEHLIDAASSRLAELEVDSSPLLLHRVRLQIRRGNYEEAEELLTEVENGRRRRSRRTSARIALLRSELMLARKRYGAAEEWAEKAFRLTRQAGSEPDMVRAILQLARIAAVSSDLEKTRRHMHELESFHRHFSLLPLAAERFEVQARYALGRDRADEARALSGQALSAWSMIGDEYRIAITRYELARLTRTSAPTESRHFAIAALQSFERLGIRRELRRLRELVRALPGGESSEEYLGEAEIAAVLTSSALSVDLVAETWLRLAERIAPNRWMGVYRFEESTGWNPVRTHGDRAPVLDFPDATADRLCDSGIDWIRLKGSPPSTYFFAMECGGEDDPACRVIENRLSAWVPVAGLAFEHAHLRLSGSSRSSGPHLSSQPEDDFLDALVFSGEPMQSVVARISRIRGSHSPALVTGERGTGKSLIAACIHRASDRRSGPFVEFDCSTVDRKRFERQLFGAIVPDVPSPTGAGRPDSDPGFAKGALAAAHEGTLVLDSIDCMPMEIQGRLNEFLENGAFLNRRLGQSVQINTRIIATSSEDVRNLVARGQFREDLFFRLNVIPVRVPPLRERQGEIPLLVQHFLRILQSEPSRRVTFSSSAIEAMLRYDWPGNVRQLKNEIDRLLVFTQSEPAPVIGARDLSEPVTAALVESATDFEISGALSDSVFTGSALEDILASAEKSVIERALAGRDGQVSAAAEMLGLTRQGLYKKMKRLGIDPARFQNGVTITSQAP